MVNNDNELSMAGCCGGGCSCSGDVADVSAASVAEAVKSHYGGVAQNAQRSTDNPTGARTEIYADNDLTAVPDEAQLASAGCGNPVGLSDVKRGEVVLDLGSGGGIDCFMAAEATGADGLVIGIDITPEMVELAQKNAKKVGSTNAFFKLGKIEAVPQIDDSVDLVISNCVISLSEHKDLVWQEVYRVLRSGGRFIISDMVSEAPLPDEARADLSSWVACVGGADSLEQMLARIKSAGFERAEVITKRKISEQELGHGENRTQTILSVTVKGFKP